MVPKPSRRVTVPVVLRRYPVDALGNLMEMDCLACGSPLQPHQPEVDHPERLLETCSACHCWYLLDLSPKDATLVMVSLPDQDHFRRAFDEE